MSSETTLASPRAASPRGRGISNDTTLEGGFVSGSPQVPSPVPEPEELLHRIETALLGGTDRGLLLGPQFANATPADHSSVRVATTMVDNVAIAAASSAASAMLQRESSPHKSHVLCHQRLHSAHRIMMVMDGWQARLLRTAIRSLSRNQMANLSGDLRSQTHSVVKTLLIRKAQAFALRMASLCRRVQSSMKLVGIHTWKHYCLKDRIVLCQVRMLQLISEARQEVAVARSETAVVDDMQAIASSNAQLSSQLKRHQGLHRCAATLLSARSRRVSFAFAQLRLWTHMCKVAFDLRGPCLAMHASIRRLCRRKLHSALQQWATWHELSRAKHELMDALMVREAMQRAKGSVHVLEEFPVS